MARRRSIYTGNSVEIDPLIRLWLLRILVPMGGHRDFIRPHGFNNDALAEVIGLGHWVDPSPQNFDQKTVQFELRKLHQQAEQHCGKKTLPACLRHNIDRLSSMVGLNTTDCRILEFAVSIYNERLLDDAADFLGSLSSVKVFYALSSLLQLPEPDVRASLSAQGILARSGLVTVDRGGTGKSQFARALAGALGCELFEVASENADGDFSSATNQGAPCEPNYLYDKG